MIGEQALQIHIDKGYTCIGERKDGHDDKRNKWMHAMLEALKRWYGIEGFSFHLGNNLHLFFF